MLRDFCRLLSPQQAQMQRGEGGQQRTEEFTPTGCLACLREKFRNSCLSAEASDLMLASWRPKSSMIPYSTSGLAGVLNGIKNPFLAL